MSNKERWLLPWSLDEQGVIRDNKGEVVDFKKDQLKFFVDFVNHYAFDDESAFVFVVNDGFAAKMTVQKIGRGCINGCPGNGVVKAITQNKQARKEYDEKLAVRHDN